MQSLRRYRYVTLAASLVACADSTEPTPAPDISGAWTFTESANISFMTTPRQSCSASGSYNLNQIEWEFTGTKTGTIVCTSVEPYPIEEMDPVDFSLSISNGKLTEDGRITFNLDGPGLMPYGLVSPVTGGSYSGTLAGDPPDRLSGSFSEVLVSHQLGGPTGGGATYPVEGSWEASR
jgi:hypothetical protein